MKSLHSIKFMVKKAINEAAVTHCEYTVIAFIGATIYAWVDDRCIAK